MTRRILVLGAGGFIGRRVVAALQTSGWAKPVATGHRSPLPWPQVASIRLDATDETELAHAVADADAVINCVAGNAETIVETARALVAVTRRGPRPLRAIHLSTMAVYGSAVGSVDESTALNGDVSAYAAAKVQAEGITAASGGAVTLRPGCVYGPGSVQWSERIANWLKTHRVGDLGVAGDGYCNLVYVDDVVSAILAALRLPGVEGQAFNLGSPAPPTWNEYFVSFAKLLGTVPVSRISRRQLVLETKFWAPPLKAMELAARYTGLHQVKLPPPMPASLLRSWGQDIRLDVRKAQKILGIAWTPIDIGLRETVAHMRMAGVA